MAHLAESRVQLTEKFKDELRYWLVHVSLLRVGMYLAYVYQAFYSDASVTRVLRCYGNVGCFDTRAELVAGSETVIKRKLKKIMTEIMAELTAELDAPRKSSSDPEPASSTGPGSELGDGTGQVVRSHRNSELAEPDAPTTSVSIAVEKDQRFPSSKVFT